jgi:sterol desaturase/sphingolipid hydroxylase (fatty acid hydroxylase superfamily)
MTSKLYSYIPLTFPEIAWPRLESQDIQIFLVLSVFAVLFHAEARWAYAKVPAPVLRSSYMANMGTFLLNDTLLSLLSVSSLWALAEHYSGSGMLKRVESPAAKAVLAFVLLDLVLYLWHWTCHRFDGLWRFHRIHHSDLSMNASTAFRTHIVEVFLTTVVKAVFIVVTGIQVATLLIAEAVLTVATMLHHANIRLPGERWLGRVMITPHLHRTHHSVHRHEHDRNYGAFFSVWDRLFGTLAEVEPARLGLHQVEPMGVAGLLLFGFKPLLPAAGSPMGLRHMIEEAAYYRAEKRGFAPGFESADWFEAEKDILGRQM